eukprot:scaffold5554_cov28-Phaeocystis_antarctica.AAC.2
MHGARTLAAGIRAGARTLGLGPEFGLTLDPIILTLAVALAVALSPSPDTPTLTPTLASTLTLTPTLTPTPRFTPNPITICPQPAGTPVGGRWRLCLACGRDRSLAFALVTTLSKCGALPLS